MKKLSANTSFGRVYAIPGNQTIYGSIRTPDEGYLLFGNAEIPGNNKKDGFLMRLDKDCNPLWHKTFGGFSNDFFNSAAFDAQGNILVAGSSSSFGLSLDTNSTQINPSFFAVYVNGNGELLWQKTYIGNTGGVNKFNDLYKVLLLPNQNFALVGTTANYGIKTALIQCINNQGKSLWQGFFYDDFQSIGFDGVNALINKDGNIVLTIFQTVYSNTLTVMRVSPIFAGGNNKFISKTTMGFNFYSISEDKVTPLSVVDVSQEKYLLSSDSAMLVFDPDGKIYTHKTIAKGGVIQENTINKGNSFFATPYNVFKTDLEGKILWESASYKPQNIDRVGGLFIDKEDQVSLFCSYWNTFKEKDIVLLKFSESGQLILK